MAAPTDGALDRDLIVAVATPPGQGGVGIVRLSGSGALALTEALCGRRLRPRRATFATVSDGDEVLDDAVVIWFPTPGSFTGEEVVEIQAHGSPVVLQRILDAACRRGARLARPGEYSERAFLNGRMDLSQAEAIADLIASASVQAARGALRSMQGEFSRRVNDIATPLEQLRILVEAAIDFPDEEVEVLEQYQVAQRLQSLALDLDELLQHCRQGQRIQEGASVALLGPPNAGKSSLLNLLSGEDAAIVTDIPGTTRDLLKVDLVVQGLPLRLVDTAGLRQVADQVEQIGVSRALGEAQAADLILLVLDITAVAEGHQSSAQVLEIAGLRPDDPRVLVVLNKTDLLDRSWADDQHGAGVRISARTGAGLDTLRHAIVERAGLGAGEPPFAARARHVAACTHAAQGIERAHQLAGAHAPPELVAEELRLAHDALGEVTGRVTPDDLLGKIFSTFCIGK